MATRSPLPTPSSCRPRASRSERSSSLRVRDARGTGDDGLAVGHALGRGEQRLVEQANVHAVARAGVSRLRSSSPTTTRSGTSGSARRGLATKRSCRSMVERTPTSAISSVSLDRVPRRAGLALADEPRDGLRGEEPGLAQPRLGRGARRRRRARPGPTKARDDRRAVRALLPPGDLRREPVLDGLAQEVLLVQPAQAELVGKARRELGHAVVEEGETTFDRMAHQHPVALRVEQVAVQEGGDLQVLSAAERRHLHEPRRQARLEAFGRVAPRGRRRQDVALEEPEQPRGVREAEPVAVEGVVDVGEALAVEADEERAGALEVLADERVQPREQQRAELGLGLARPEMAHRVLPEEVVPAEELVRPLAGGDHLQARLLDGAGEAQERRRRGAERRLLRQLHGLREELGDVAGADRHAGEIEAAGAGEAILVVALVEARILEADAEAVERLVHLLERVRDDGGRVEAAAQVRGDGDVGPQAQARGVSEQRIQLVREPGALGRRARRRRPRSGGPTTAAPRGCRRGRRAR